MKKVTVLSLSAILATQLMGAEDLSEMIKEGKFGGYVRVHHIEPAFSDTTAATGSVIGGKLKYQTGALYGLRFGAAMYTTHDTGLTKWDYITRDNRNQIAGGLLGDDLGSYTTLGEAYVSYRLSNTDLTYGRQEFQTPMTQNAVTIIPNLFEGTVATIKELPDVKITAAHITKIQYGTRSVTDKNMIGDSGYGVTAGAGAGLIPATFSTTTGLPTNTPSGKEEFQDMSNALYGANKVDSSGVTTLGIDYKKGNINIRAWDYYAHEIMNTIYADVEYKMDTGAAKLTLGAQILKQDDVGGLNTNKNITGSISPLVAGTGPSYSTVISRNGEIDAMLWGLQAKADIGNFSVSAAYNQNKDGHIINPWGGDPGYTSMIFARNEYRADTNAYKLGAEYDFKDLGIPGLKFIVNHAAYDTDVQASAVSINDGSFNASLQRNEKTDVQDYILHYAVPSVKGLWFRLFNEQRDNGTKNFEHGHTRLIANLSF